jgi:hypothetical protein
VDDSGRSEVLLDRTQSTRKCIGLVLGRRCGGWRQFFRHKRRIVQLLVSPKMAGLALSAQSGRTERVSRKRSKDASSLLKSGHYILLARYAKRGIVLSLRMQRIDGGTASRLDERCLYPQLPCRGRVELLHVLPQNSLAFSNWVIPRKRSSWGSRLKPIVLARIDVQHHAWHRPTRPPFAMGSLLLPPLYQPGFLQRGLHPRVVLLNAVLFFSLS